MPDRDPLIDLLHAADAASAPPASSTDLPHRVHARRAQQIAYKKHLTIGSAAIAIVAIALLAPVTFNRLVPNNTLPPAASSLLPADVATLRAEADQLVAEADALQRQVTAIRLEQSRQDLREEYRRQLAANIDADAAQSPIDRAAAIALCQGDFYWEVQQNRAPAQAAYQSILDNFPNSPLASVAQSRLQQLQMN